MPEMTVRDNPDQQRFEITLDGEFAGVADYRIDDGRVLMPRVEVLPQFEGMGVGSALVKQALVTIREENWGTVVPMCPFVDVYIRRHAEYQDLVDGQA
jgi:uncharacterized protein